MVILLIMVLKYVNVQLIIHVNIVQKKVKDKIYVKLVIQIIIRKKRFRLDNYLTIEYFLLFSENYRFRIFVTFGLLLSEHYYAVVPVELKDLLKRRIEGALEGAGPHVAKHQVTLRKRDVSYLGNAAFARALQETCRLEIKLAALV